MDEEHLKALYDSLGPCNDIPVTSAIFRIILQEKNTRDPTMTEIRVLDTYWSDHCRHTTFSTELKNVTFGDGDYREPIEGTHMSSIWLDRERDL